MKKKTLKTISISIILLAIIIATTITILTNSTIQKKETTHKFPFDFHVVDDKKVGFNLDPDIIHFGNLCTTCIATRKITVENNANYSKELEIFIESEQKEVLQTTYVHPSNPITVAPFEKTTIEITVAIQNKLSKGKYNGTVIVTEHKK